MSPDPVTADRAAIERLLAGECQAPHDLLGPQGLLLGPRSLPGPLDTLGTHDGPAAGDAAEPANPDAATTLLRAFHPDARRCECVLNDGTVTGLDPKDGIFVGRVPRLDSASSYRLRFTLHDGSTCERGDPYGFAPTLGDLDLHLLGEGTHRRLWQVLGSHVRTHEGVRGVSFAVWAPTARRVSVVGDFCRWNGLAYPMRRLAESGIFELFIPGLAAGTHYKYEILGHDGRTRTKSDPVGLSMEHQSGHATRVIDEQTFAWTDQAWMAARDQAEPTREPLLIYEIHLGSWRRDAQQPERFLNYREIAPLLAAHVGELGFTHVELLPVLEHPYGASWGYQVGGYYAPTSRHGSPDDFRFFVDTLHAAGIGVILDWVPAHFPRDDFALRRFDGTALYEHLDPRRGEHPDWGTMIFNFGRPAVRNFLIANALYWLEEFHIDGLRVDAVASMLYLDYSRDEGQWIPNKHGGRENLEAVEFLRDLNRTVFEEQPGCITIAEESTSWPDVTRAVDAGGLGFTFKWNMGWMNDTLEYFGEAHQHRRHHHDKLTFAAMYEWSERFIMPLSHDEVVHGKGSLLGKMVGDEWQRLANLRALYAYQLTRPGKALLFMGSELAPASEWNHDASLDWSLAEHPRHGAVQRYLGDLARLVRARPCLYRSDPDQSGFAWIDCHDSERSVLSYLRRDGDDLAIIVLNLTPEPRQAYRLGVPQAGAYEVLLDSDHEAYGGSEVETGDSWTAEARPHHGHPCSLLLDLPPLAAIILAPTVASPPTGEVQSRLDDPGESS